MSQRITIRLDDTLYDRLLTYAQGRANGQTPEVSSIVREALGRYLRPQHDRGSKMSDTQRDTKTRSVRHGRA